MRKHKSGLVDGSIALPPYNAWYAPYRSKGCGSLREVFREEFILKNDFRKWLWSG